MPFYTLLFEGLPSALAAHVVPGLVELAGECVLRLVLAEDSAPLALVHTACRHHTQAR